MNVTKISWTDITWNTLRGCTKISRGCENCYAATIAARFSGKDCAFEGLGYFAQGSGEWTNRLRLVEEKMEDPLRMKTPKRIFVNSVSDTFHPDVPTEYLNRIIDVMRRASWHEFQVLTKRADRMEEVLQRHEWPANAWLGVTVEDPSTLWRLDPLRRVKAQTKFLSLEPLLAPLLI